MHTKRFKTVMIVAVSIICIGVMFVVLWAGIRRKQRENSYAYVQAEISEYRKDGSAEDLVTSLMPYIEAHYPVKTGAENTAIAGNSMGGRNAIYAAYTYPDRFGYVGAFSSGPVVEAANGSDWMPCLMQELPTDAKPFNLLMIVTGKTDEICGKYSYQLDDYMNKHGIKHIFYDTTGGHQTVVWQNALYNFTKKLFIQ